MFDEPGRKHKDNIDEGAMHVLDSNKRQYQVCNCMYRDVKGGVSSGMSQSG